MSTQLSDELRSSCLKVIEHTYSHPSEHELAILKSQADAKAIEPLPNLSLVNSYYAQNLPGTRQKLYARAAVVERINTLAKHIRPHLGFMIFDAYRSVETQSALYQWMCDQVRAQNPSWSEDDIKTEARVFATDPTYRPYAVPPHNSGGAIDLALYELSSGQMLAFGSEFDEATNRSRTDFYEGPFDPSSGFSEQEWLDIRCNRRLLFQLMKDAGFTNYASEWWHFDLGDCMWASIHGIDWQYDSLKIS